MNKERIEKAVKVINFAIENKTSVTDASVKFGYADTYVKNVKRAVYEQYNLSLLDDDLFSLFNDAYENYLQMYNTPVVFTNTFTSKPNEEPIVNKCLNNEKISVIESQDGKYKDVEITYPVKSSYSKNHIKTLDDLLLMTNVDLDVWKVRDFLVNKWDVTSWKNNQPETVENFQVKAKLEKNIKFVQEKAIGELFKEMISSYKPPIYDISQQNSNLCSGDGSENIFEVTLFDLHLGKLAWGGETGENYDTKIAKTRYLKTINDLINHSKGFEYSKILFPIGSDFFNSDTITNTTTQGTPQDEDLRWQKTFDVGTRLLVDAIYLLRTTGKPVDVVVIPGNHDFQRSYYLGAFLSAWFNDDNNVNINNGASPRKYYRFGKVLLGYTHGSEEKESSLPLLMATDLESKIHWTDTDFHEWHVGHIHRKRDVKFTVLDKSRMTNEDLGVTVRYLSSLTGTEEWHHKKGFVGSIKAGEAFIWNSNNGMIAHLNANLIIE